MKELEVVKDRDVLFGRILAICDVIGEKIYPNEIKLEHRYFDKFIKKPASIYKTILEELMIHNNKFGATEWNLLHLLDKIIDELGADRCNDEPLKNKYIWGLSKQRHILHSHGYKTRV
ncbi:type I-C CRISPR-associated protein Cas8c/Csd1 [Bacillus altitudinis]|uniref:type I-C CRISPR-associated protein Cas8c/Csd1 n=1 Tax=Bacillus altitudinis TaxID=293387 RepID=UPI002F926214